VSRTGAQVLVDQLRIHGVDTVFCVPGESFLAALDALGDARDAIRLVVCRHEGGAATMAEAYGKLTGRPAACFVTRGPGATNASIGVHTARQDSTPMLLLVGHVARPFLGREAFQEVDYERVFGGLAKWAGEVLDAARIPELVSRALHTATSGRPGPAVLALPEDVLEQECDSPDALPYTVSRPAPAEEQLIRLRELLAGSARPLALVGGSVWSAEAAADLAAWAEANAVPVCTSFRRQDSIDNRSSAYCGYAGVGMDPSTAQLLRESDFLLALGARLGEATTGGYELLSAPATGKRLVHVYPDPDELGRVYEPTLGIVSGPPQLAAALRRLAAVDSSGWNEWSKAARASYLETLDPRPMPGGLDMGQVLVHLRERLPGDAILTNGAGNFSVWPQRLYRFTAYGTQLGPTSGAMGYGVPAAVAAKLVHPDRIVVCFSGDGDFLMTGQELATAVRYGADAVFLVVNNSMYGTIRMHQERAFPGRPYGTDLVNPDFAAYAEAFGAYGEVVERTSAFPDAFGRALAAGVPALLELRVDPEALTPRATLTEIREGAMPPTV
jgi:acetolactate synthase-1/2/3 large subunit